MSFSASSDWVTTTNEDALLDLIRTDLEGDCDYSGREPYEDPLYTGSFDTYVNCGDGNFILLVQVQANADRDFEALDRILASFYVSGDV